MPQSNVVFRPTVIIGLGGTGHGAILKLKKRFMDVYPSVPPIIRFLSIDTTENVEHSETAKDGSTVTLEPGSERYVISVSNPAGLVNGTNPHIDEWWPSNIPILAISAGAGQVRARGRLALFAKSKEIFSAIGKAIDDVKQIKNKKQMYKEDFRVSDRGGVEVYIVGSLAGGTGSGTFLDVAFITRSFLDSLSNITGVLALPRVFKDLAGVSLVKPNAYGALKEIEQFTKLDRNDFFKINYGTHEIEVNHPPFDLLYLMDSINEAGNVIREPRELLELIADGLYIQIGSQIGTDAENTVDNVKTHLAMAGKVKGRSVNYCSFGVASLTLPLRQYETMQIEDARRLINDGLLNGMVADAELESDVVRFLVDHKLREDDFDDVIDALSENEGGGQLRFHMPIGQIKYDRTAQATIKQLHVTQRNKVERQIAQSVEANFKRLLDRSVSAIDEWFEQVINRPNGLNYAQRFADKLLAKLEWYQKMMESEAREEAERMKSLNFSTYEEQVREAGTAFLRRETRVRTACENFKGIVDRESNLQLQVARREKAAELYGALRDHVEKTVIFKCARLRVNLEAALKSFERLYLDKTTQRTGETPFEHVVRFTIEGDRPHLNPEDFLAWFDNSHGSLSLWSNMREEDVHLQISEYLAQRYRPLTDLSIDKVLSRSGTATVLQDLRQLDSLAVPLWKWDSGKIPVDKLNAEEMYYYGVENADETILTDSKVQGNVPQGAYKPTFVSTLDKERITLFKVKIGVPLFALQGIEEMERAYNDPDKTVSNHLHREWETFPNVIPRGGDGEALRWFAIAQAPQPFEIVSRRGDWYYIRSQRAKKTDNGEIRLGQGRLNAFQAFEKDRDLIKEVEERVDSIARTKGAEEIARSLRDYSEKLQKQVAGGKIDDSIREQVEGELQSIDSYLSRIATIR